MLWGRKVGLTRPNVVVPEMALLILGVCWKPGRRKGRDLKTLLPHALSWDQIQIWNLNWMSSRCGELTLFGVMVFGLLHPLEEVVTECSLD